jgi:hypothetical protein
MRYVAVILALLLLLVGRTRVEADGYTERQTEVIGLICDACERYEVDCTLPLAIARRESGFGANVVSGTDHAADGTALSIGVFQWHALGLGGYRGPGYEDDWRWDVRRDVEREEVISLLGEGQQAQGQAQGASGSGPAGHHQTSPKSIS